MTSDEQVKRIQLALGSLAVWLYQQGTLKRNEVDTLMSLMHDPNREIPPVVIASPENGEVQ